MSAVLELTIADSKPILRGHDHWWSVIRDLGRDGATFTVADIAARSDGRRQENIDDFVRRLARAGYASEAGWRQEKSRRYRLWRLDRRPTATPVLRRDGSSGRQGAGQLQMWTAMRQLADWTAVELAMAATTDACRVAARSALAYALRLEHAGYLAVLDRGGPGRPKRWRLKPSMNTGPQAPMILRTKLVWDANRRKPMGPVLAEEDRP